MRARLQALLARGAALGLALEKWQRAGLWVRTRGDPEYPDRLKRRLRSESPPVLFGCGNKSLLAGGGIAVVGSRDASEDDLAFTAQFGKRAAAEGYSIVSGGARRVDQAAMMGALEHEGTAVGVLADSLLRSATSAQYRKRIMSGDLVLITPFNPEAGFNVGHAMARNRYIYCLADAAVVVSSAAGKG
jgi:predicted Rossmann fold nucleotide-binding protein DprA/Smf involved in DNA uptake